jgi:elongation factor Ts
MATVTAAEVNELRTRTGAGMMDCRKALIESDGDFEKAIDYLRKKGQKVAAKRSDRETKEGVVITLVSDDKKKGVIICLSCETDFVARNDEFTGFAKSVAQAALDHSIASIEALNNEKVNGEIVSNKINDLIGKIGEKITISRYEKIDAGYTVSYTHGDYRIGVLAGFSKPLDEAAAKDVAMQIAAMNPIAVDESSVPADMIAREKEIAVEQVKGEGKPAEMAEKIAIGKVNKFFKEQTLLAQPFVKDNKLSVAAYLKSVDPDVKVTGFKRVALG